MRVLRCALVLCAAGVSAGACSGSAQTQLGRCALTVEAPVVTFGGVAMGQSAEVAVTVSAAHDDCLVTSVDVSNLDGTYFQAAASDAQDTDAAGSGSVYSTASAILVPHDGSAQIPLWYHPRTAGLHRATVVLGVEDGAPGQVEFEVRDHAALAEETYYPGMIDFGAVLPGEVGSGFLTIDNAQGQALVIDELVFSSADGASTTSELSTTTVFPYTLPPQTSQQLEVRYTPVIERAMSATMGVVVGDQRVWNVRLIANDPASGVPALPTRP